MSDPTSRTPPPLKQYGQIVVKASNGQSLTISDLQYLQRLSWSTKTDTTTHPQNAAIDKARTFLAGFKDAAGQPDTVVLKEADGTKVPVEGMGINYKAFHESGVTQSTKAMQKVLDSYVQNKGASVLSAGGSIAAGVATQPSGTTTATGADTNGTAMTYSGLPTSGDPTPSSVASSTAGVALGPPVETHGAGVPNTTPMPATQDDELVKHVALAHLNTNGSLPGPQQMNDLLTAGLTMQDLDPEAKNSTAPPGQDAWEKFFKMTADAKAGSPPPRDAPIAVSGNVANQMQQTNTMPNALATAHVHPQASPSTPPPALSQGMHTNSPWVKSLNELLSATGDSLTETQRWMQARGYQTMPGDPSGYVQAANNLSFDANLAPAVWNSDKDAAAALLHTADLTQGQFTNVGINVLANEYGGRNSDAFKNFVYDAALRSRPDDVGKAAFPLWYAAKYPAGLTAQMKATADAEGAKQATSRIGGYLHDVAHVWNSCGPLAQQIGTFFADEAHVAGDVGHAIVGANSFLENDKWTGWFVGNTEHFLNDRQTTLGKVMQVPYTELCHAASFAVAGAAIDSAHQQAAILAQNSPTLSAITGTTPASYRKAVQGVDNIDPKLYRMTPDALHAYGQATSMIDDSLEQWKTTSTQQPVYTLLRGMNVNPADHALLAWSANFAATNGLAILAGNAAGAAVGVLGTTDTALTILEKANIASHTEIMASATSAARLREAYNVDEETAVLLAGTNDPEAVRALLVDANGEKTALGRKFGPDMNFSSRNIAKNLQMKMLDHPGINSLVKKILVPMENNSVHIADNPDQWALEGLRVAKVPEAECYAFADRVLAAKTSAESLSDQAVMDVLKDPETGYDATIRKSLQSQPAKARFLKDNPDATAWDEFQSFQGRFRKAYKLPTDPTVGRVAYGAGTDAPETSLRLGGAGFNRTRKAIRAQEAELPLVTEHLGRIDEALAKGTINGRLSPALETNLRALKDKLLERSDALQAEDAARAARIREEGMTEVGVPTAHSEGQFRNIFDPAATHRELAIFRGGKSMQEWSIIQRTLHLDDINNAFKRMWLSRIGTLGTIMVSDSGIRNLAEGVNPFSIVKDSMYDDPAYQAQVESELHYLRMHPQDEADIGGTILQKKPGQWSFVGPNGPPEQFNAGARATLATLKSEKSILTSDWTEAYDAALADEENKALAARMAHPEGTPTEAEGLTSGEMKASAQTAADKVVHDNLRNDPRYYGNENNPGLLPHRDPMLEHLGTSESSRALAEIELQSFENQELTRLHNWQGQPDTAAALRNGKLSDSALANSNVRDAVGNVQYAMNPEASGGSKWNLLRRASDWQLGLLSGMSQELNEDTFTHFFGERYNYLLDSGLTPEEIEECAGRHAASKVKELSYVGGKTLLEENLRNLSFFIPAYRQFYRFWGERMLTHPFTTGAIMNDFSQLPTVRIPNKVPIVGGISQNFGTMNFFGGLQTSDSGRSVLPPVSGVLGGIVEMASAVGVPEAQHFFKLMNGGHTPGAPLLRWADSLLYGITGLTRHGGDLTPYGAAAGLHIDSQFPGTSSIYRTRARAINYNLVAQGMAGGGAAINVATATRSEQANEVGKGIINYLTPGSTATTLPIITVKMGKRNVKVDMNQLQTAMYLDLQATTPAEHAAVVKRYPIYTDVAAYYQLKPHDGLGLGEVELAYLSQHRWIIGLTSQRAVSTKGHVGIQAATPEERAIFKQELAPAAVAVAMKQRFDEVDRYDLAQKYNAAMAQWATDYQLAHPMDKTTHPLEYKHLYGPTSLTYQQSQMAAQAKFYHDNNQKKPDGSPGEMDRLLRYQISGATGTTPVGLTPNKAGGKELNSYKYPMLLVADPYGAKIPTTQLKMMMSLDASGESGSHALLLQSPYYAEYLKQSAVVRATDTTMMLRAVLSPVKSALTADQWQMFGLNMTVQDEAAMQPFFSDLDKLDRNLAAMRAKASANPGATITGTESGGSSALLARVEAATKNVPYSWGGGSTTGPTLGIAQGANTVGFDCSGLVRYVYAQFGITLPRGSAAQSQSGRPVSRKGLQSGDLVFFNTGGGPQPGHVGIYAGGGKMWSAQHTGTVVGLNPVDWGSFSSARRVLPNSMVPTSTVTGTYSAYLAQRTAYIIKAKGIKGPVQKYLASTATDLLGMGSNALTKPHFSAATTGTYSEWNAMTSHIVNDSVSAAQMLVLKNASSPDLQRNWPAAASAWGWLRAQNIANQGKAALVKGGYTVGSTQGKQIVLWANTNMKPYLNPKDPSYGMFGRQWAEAEKLTGGNVFRYLCDPTR